MADRVQSGAASQLVGLPSARAAVLRATAAFGTAMAQKTEVLVRFRDEQLKKSEAGQTFIRLYYKYSPLVADSICGRPWLKAVVRILLLPLVGFVSLLL